MHLRKPYNIYVHLARFSIQWCGMWFEFALILFCLATLFDWVRNDAHTTVLTNKKWDQNLFLKGCWLVDSRRFVSVVIFQGDYFDLVVQFRLLRTVLTTSSSLYNYQEWFTSIITHSTPFMNTLWTVPAIANRTVTNREILKKTKGRFT